jgi:iron complex transport system substrate-binding protein
MAARPPRLTAAVALALAAAWALHAAAQAPARRIVSLVPAVTEMLFAIGAGPQVVAVSSYDEYPPQVKPLPRVGALLDPDVERILALRPDLLISYGSQGELQGQMARAGVAVLNYRHAGLQGIFDTVTRVGAATGRTAEAATLVSTLRTRLDRVRAAVRGKPKPRTLLVFERDPGTLRGIYASGGRGFLHEMLEIAGGVNVFADVDREAVEPSSEQLLARAPDIIIEVRATGLLTGDEASGAERHVWAPLASIPAVRNGRIHFLSGDYLVVPGPRVADATDAFARVLHPGSVK